MASGEVFVDTSGLYALIDRRDTHHAEARDVVGKLVRSGKRLVVTDQIVAESVNLANARSGHHVAVRVIDLIEQSTGIRLERVHAERFEATKAFFRRHADQGFSFTDCTSFVVMRELRIRAALTTDKHFAAAGFETLLARNHR